MTEGGDNKFPAIARGDRWRSGITTMKLTAAFIQHPHASPWYGNFSNRSKVSRKKKEKERRDNEMNITENQQ